MDESPRGTDSYLVVQSLPTFDDMRFKTPLNKVKAADPDFLDPSSGWAVDRAYWEVKPLSSFLTLLLIKSILRCPKAGETNEGLIDQLEQIHNLVPSVLNEGIKAGIVELVDSKPIYTLQLPPFELVKQALNTDGDSSAPSTTIHALNVRSPHSQMRISENPLCRVDSLLPATKYYFIFSS
ncbi:hypothetical protein Tco_0563216 [Tanacetum coccineum]